MPQNFIEAPKAKAGSAWIPLIGFVMLIVIAIISYLVAPLFQDWLTHAKWALAGTTILPLDFPATWTDEMVRLAVAAMVWLGLFAIGMIVLLLMMGSPLQETDINLADIRKEKEKQLGRKIRK